MSNLLHPTYALPYWTYVGASAFFGFLWLYAFAFHSQMKSSLSSAHASLCGVVFAYCLINTFILPFNHDYHANFLMISLMGVIGHIAILFYNKVLLRFFEVDHPLKKFFLVVNLLAALFYGVSLVGAWLFGPEYFLRPEVTEFYKGSMMSQALQGHEVKPLVMYVAIPLNLIIFANFGWLLWLSLTQRKKDLVIVLGIVISMLCNLNDNLVGVASFNLIMPLMPLGYLVEILRFHTYFLKRTHQTIRIYKDELQSMSHLHNRSVLMRGLFHDLNQYISRQRLPASVAEGLKSIIYAYDINLDVKKMKSSSNQVNLHEAVELVCDLFLPTLRAADISVENRVSKSLFIKADSSQVTAILSNLIGNSIDALENSKKRLIVFHSEKKKFVESLYIEDSGPGLPLEVLPTLFVGAHTTKLEGTGIGLLCAQRLAHLNGAYIRYVERPTGACFAIDFSR